MFPSRPMAVPRQILAQLKNISVQGNLVGGRIFLSESLTGLKDINFDLQQVPGEVLIPGESWKGETLPPSGRRPEFLRVY